MLFPWAVHVGSRSFIASTLRNRDPVFGSNMGEVHDLKWFTDGMPVVTSIHSPWQVRFLKFVVEQHTTAKGIGIVVSLSASVCFRPPDSQSGAAPNAGRAAAAATAAR